MTAKEYQSTILDLLSVKFQELEICDEWRAFKGLNYIYSPRVDIAVGPFSDRSGYNKIQEYNQLILNVEINKFLKRIYDIHIENIGNDWLYEIKIPEFNNVLLKNQNARCLLAIEIENSSTKKHIMGSMINAASLGRIGIGIAYNASALRTFKRLLNYLAFLKRVEKNTYDTTNFLIITKEQFLSVINDNNNFNI
jgi:hypothetical protein